MCLNKIVVISWAEESERHQIFPINHLGLVRCEIKHLSDRRHFQNRTCTESLTRHAVISSAVGQQVVSTLSEAKLRGHDNVRQLFVYYFDLVSYPDVYWTDLHEVNCGFSAVFREFSGLIQ